MDNTELIRGHVDTIILRVLEDRDRYGYEILDLISDMSDGRYAIKQATLYSCLKRLEKQGFISSYFGEETNGGRRRYYKLDEKGKKTLSQDQREWEFSRTLLDKLLSDKKVDLKTVEAPFNSEELRPLTKRVKAYDIPDPERRICSVQTAPIVIPITVEAKTVQAAPEQKSQLQNQAPSPAAANAASVSQPMSPPVPNFFSAILTPVQTAPSAPNPAPVPQSGTNFSPVNVSPSPTIEKEIKKEQIPQKTDSPIPISDEKAREEELRINASRLLQLGEFAPPPTSVVQQMIAKPDAAMPKSDAKPDYQKQMDSGINKAEPAVNPIREAHTSYTVSSYKDTLANLFGKRGTAAPEAAAASASEAVKPEELPPRRQFYDLKQELAAEGYKLKSYSRATASDQYYMNYVYGSRLLRDTSLLLYLTIIIELILLYITRNIFGYQINTLITIGAIALVLPLFGTAVWIFHPEKRKKAKFSLTQSLINSVIAYILIVAFTTIIYLVSPSIDIGFQDPQMYVPYILGINIPLFVLIYNFLYKSKHYHIR